MNTLNFPDLSVNTFLLLGTCDFYLSILLDCESISTFHVEAGLWSHCCCIQFHRTCCHAFNYRICRQQIRQCRYEGYDSICVKITDIHVWETYLGIILESYFYASRCLLNWPAMLVELQVHDSKQADYNLFLWKLNCDCMSCFCQLKMEFIYD